MDLRGLLMKTNLHDFVVQELTEVFKTDDDGRRVSSLGAFHSEKIAKGFAEIQVDANWHGTRKVIVLANKVDAFVLGEQLKILDDEQGKLAIARKARSKLSDAEAEALGISNFTEEDSE